MRRLARLASPTRLALLAMAPLAAACATTQWKADADLLAPPRLVAAALGDPTAPGEEEIDPTGIPLFDPPKQVRPCCELGMDQRVKLGEAEVPGFKRPNMISADALGHHAYDGGLVPLTADDRGLGAEQNGIVYTCRGGFIDTAHIRDYSDWTFFVALRLARSLPEGTTLELRSDGALRRVTVRAVPAELVTERGRFAVAGALAQWIVHRLAIWHEIATWYDWQSVKGFSEKGSAFSPEDLYSNILGMKIAAALAEKQLPVSRSNYDIAMDAWIPAVLRRLGAVTLDASRAAMGAVDGVWWDSHKLIPDPTMVTRRKMDIGPRQAAWRLEDALPEGDIPPAVKAQCAHAAPPLVLNVPEGIGPVRFADLVGIEIEPEEWAEKNGFPFPHPGERKFTLADFPALMKSVAADMAKTLGAGFEHPENGPHKPAPPAPEPPAQPVSLQPAAASPPPAPAPPAAPK